MTAAELAARVLVNPGHAEDLIHAVDWGYHGPWGQELTVAQIIEKELEIMTWDEDLPRPSDAVIEEAWGLVDDGALAMCRAAQDAAGVGERGVERILWG